MGVANGKVIKLDNKGLDNPTVVDVEYYVNDICYVISESLKLESKVIKIDFIPIGQKKIPKINCSLGSDILVEYDDNNPAKAYIKGNDGDINC